MEYHRLVKWASIERTIFSNKGLMSRSYTSGSSETVGPDTHININGMPLPSSIGAAIEWISLRQWP